MNVLRNALLWSSQNKWIERQFRRRRFAQRAISRFMPGETVDAALDAAEGLKGRGIGTIVSCLGENVSSAAEIESVAEHYAEVLEKIQTRQLDSHISIKPTHLGFDVDADATADHLETLLTEAAKRQNFVWIDMESSGYVDATLDLFRRARDRHENVGVCLQAYLYRTAQDLEDLLARDAVIRLVKGAYMESAQVAFPQKRDVDGNYLALAAKLLDHSKSSPSRPPAMATHDLAVIREVRQMATERSVPRERFEIDMLFGIRTAEQYRLADAGIPTRVLISYGEAWFAWYMRRLAERPANMGFVLRSMVR